LDPGDVILGHGYVPGDGYGRLLAGNDSEGVGQTIGVSNIMRIHCEFRIEREFESLGTDRQLQGKVILKNPG